MGTSLSTLGLVSKPTAQKPRTHHESVAPKRNRPGTNGPELTSTVQKLPPPSAAPLAESNLGVQLRSYSRAPVTVVAIDGEIDARNADHVSDYLAGFVHLDHPLVVDLSSIDFLGLDGYRVIVGFGAQRRIAQRAWAVVTSAAA